MDECPSCGGEMVERRRARRFTINLTGDEGADDVEVEDEEPDLIGWECEDCGHQESAEYRGEEDEDGNQDDGEED